jgi:hypothetical protein
VAVVNTLGRMLFIIFITIDEPGAVFKTLHFLNNLLMDPAKCTLLFLNGPI